MTDEKKDTPPETPKTVVERPKKSDVVMTKPDDSGDTIKRGPVEMTNRGATDLLA
ncbi:MAG TPA: hypothetical protein VGO33_14805 [Gemmatimonadaceae bacterium]|jgi:hypothetical protein|nr:hypothetical protein [Gemmatimonadaceae bacterium]